MIARAVVFQGVDSVALGETEIPEPRQGEVLIESAYTCVSPGTELRCLAGQQDGSPPWPVIPGYAMVGRIVRAGPGTTLAVGTPVLCAGTSQSSVSRLWGGHVSHGIQPEADVFPVPEGMDLLDAVAARLAAIAHRGLRLTRPQPHETVAVVGLGIVGQLSARLHALCGARVVAADLAPGRVEIAQRGGVEAFAATDGLLETLRPVVPNGADVVVEATGLPAMLPLAIELARDLPPGDTLLPEARLLVQATYVNDYRVPYFPAFRKELTILHPRDRRPRDMRAALDLIHRGKLVVRDLVSQVRPPEEAPEAYAALRERSGDVLTVVFRWRGT